MPWEVLVIGAMVLVAVFSLIGVCIIIYRDC